MNKTCKGCYAAADYLVQLSDDEGFCYSIVEALEEGTPIICTPLPKGHGELIDRNDLKYEKYNSYAYAIANAPTIIEADKAESEDKHISGKERE